MIIKNGSNTMEHDSINARPWVRYWARYIDMYYMAALIIMLQKIFFPTRQLDLNIATVGMYIIWILLEAQLLATWGTTPGKWLLKTKVRDANNNKLSLKTALSRAFLVWFMGLGMTVLSPITEVIAYSELVNNGVTAWDKRLNCNVIHEDFGSERIPLIVGAIMLPLFVIGYL